MSVPKLDAGRTQAAGAFIGPFHTISCEYDGSSNLIYFGSALPGSAKAAAVWRIAKLTYSGTDMTDLQWADGNSQFDNVWDDRASLSYS